MAFHPHRTGRQKVRLRRQQTVAIFQEAERKTQETILPEVKKFLNELPLKLRIRAAVQILLGRF